MSVSGQETAGLAASGLPALAVQLQHAQEDHEPRPRWLGEPAAAPARHRGSNSRLLPALKVLVRCLEPALVVVAAGLWLYVLNVFANNSP